MMRKYTGLLLKGNGKMTTASKSYSSDFWIGVISPFALALVVFPLILLRGWVLTLLWQWYIVPAFGVAPLRIVFAFGISLVVLSLTREGCQQKDDKPAYIKLALAFSNPLLTLLLGWIGSFFV
jgi:hypothetical protein